MVIKISIIAIYPIKLDYDANLLFSFFLFTLQHLKKSSQSKGEVLE